MEKLVKQIRVVTKDFMSLVETAKSRILTEWLCHISYLDIFRYDPLNKTTKYCKFVPACRPTLLVETRDLSRGADHARIRGFSVRQRMQSKCVLNIICKSKAFVLSRSFFKKRYYMCKADSNCIKRDDGTNNAIGQDVRNKHAASQGDLSLLKKEIRLESKRLSLLLVNSIKQGIWLRF